jgi:hypothetical protein
MPNFNSLSTVKFSQRMRPHAMEHTIAWFLYGTPEAAYYVAREIHDSKD